MRLHELPAHDDEGHLRVVVESPRGSRLKLKYQPELAIFTVARPLVLGVSYPFDWGFVPSTEAEDGDPLDAMVLLDAPTYPGVVVACEPIGVVRVEQRAKKGGRERNDRVIASPVQAPRFDGLRDARRLPKRTRDEIERFFLAAVTLERKDVKLLGWGAIREARALVGRALRR
jgi:inorganic pyrophosphatase